MDWEDRSKLIAAGTLILLWSLESWRPAAKGRRDRLRHGVRNLSLGLLSSLAAGLLAGPLIVRMAEWAERAEVGALRQLTLPPLASGIAAILLIDGWMYLWHRANHEIPFLWRFHRVHHSDPEMDVTTAIRFHAGELLISSALRLIVLPLLGVSLGQLLDYETILLPAILFHHSNVNLPERQDRWVRALIVSPAVHRVHHSRIRVETDSNYGSVFSFWDRFARTFRLRANEQPVNFGLDGYDDETYQRITGLLITPFISGPERNLVAAPINPPKNNGKRPATLRISNSQKRIHHK